MLSFGVTTSLLAFVPPFAAGQFAIFGIQVMLALHGRCKTLAIGICSTQTLGLINIAVCLVQLCPVVSTASACLLTLCSSGL